MNKTRLYLIIIVLVALLAGLISINQGRNGIPMLFAYTASCDSVYGPDVISAMDDRGVTCSTLGPPVDAYGDTSAWRAVGVAVSTPIITVGSNNVAVDGNSPTAAYTLGSNFMRVDWRSQNQYIYLPVGMFENQGCSGAPQNWSCYDYVNFNVYLNANIQGSPVPLVPQKVAFYDGNFSVTTTAGVGCKLTDGIQTPYNWKQHVSVSIQWLANQYDPTSGLYFDVDNVQSVTILAPVVNYSSFTLTGGYMYAYYDALKLGTGLNEYGAPPSITITTVNVGAIHGAYVSWNPFPDTSYVNSITPTAYEIYRSVNGGAAGPYQLVSGSPKKYDPSLPLGITDTACPGGNVFCYKVLTCNYGPDWNSNTFVTMGNTVNAVFHQDLLDNITAVCGWVDAIPTATVTPTATMTIDPFLTPGTPTATATTTPTITPTISNDIASAHVYPNPFNPIATEGSGRFYVENVVYDTKVKIFSMDGSLVMDGALNSEDLHYDPSVFPPRFWWDGKNKNGAQVVSGLYYLVLEAPDGATNVIRVIICYKCDPVYRP